MIRLSDRLMKIADQVDQNSTVADIGTDHGLLPIYLIQNRICRKAILSDISEGSLKKAGDNLKAAVEEGHLSGITDPGAIFDLRLGSGIEILQNGEADNVIIAGMGGMLISEILEKDPEKTSEIKKFILQPRNKEGRLRYRIIKAGLKIEKDILVREGRFICQIITAIPGGMPRKDEEMPAPYDDISYRFPETLLENGDIAVEYIRQRLIKEMNVMDNIIQNGINATDSKKEEIEHGINYLEELITKGA